MGKLTYSPLSLSDRLSQDAELVQTLAPSTLKKCFFGLTSLVTLGALCVVCAWKPRWQAKLLYTEIDGCEARAVLLRGRDGTFCIADVEIRDQIRCFRYRKQTYYWDRTEQRFTRLQYNQNFNGCMLHSKLSNGLSSQEAEKLIRIYGKNTLNIDITSIKWILWTEISSPFFLFQIFSIALWMYEDYVLYSLVILVTLLISLVATVVETREALVKVQQVAAYSTLVTVKRDAGFLRLPSEDIVPGDVIELEANWKLPCDVLLISGSLIVNEGLLTGESTAVWKTPMPSSTQLSYAVETCKQYLVNSGTTVIHTENQTLGLVLATGFQTVQGELINSIIYPKPCRFKFEKQSVLFISAFAVVALLGLLLCMRSFILEKYTALDILLTALDSLTIVIPPALPLAMSIGATLAAGRLARSGVMCSLRQAINPSGRVSVICFDKTGTLTEDSMAFSGALAYIDGQFLALDGQLRDENAAEIRNCVATCQGLTKIEGEVNGDPQEVTLQRKLNFDLVEEPGKREVTLRGACLRILHTYHFTPTAKRMGAVVVTSTEELHLYVKGAPEVIAPLCISLPAEFEETLHAYSNQGFRILACAGKPLPFYTSHQLLSDIDSDLTFLGLIIFHNPLKPDVGALIHSVQTAGIQVIIATGDHVVTGLAVAREIGLLSSSQDTYICDAKNERGEWGKIAGSNVSNPEERTWVDRAQSGDQGFSVAVTGSALELLCEEAKSTPFADLDLALPRLKVCGRMSPAHKVMLVEELQKRGHIVAMCGDGANDCGALKTADVGVSVGSSGSSIAAGFCGSAVSEIDTVLREGRAALASSFQCFKFIALYSLIQFFSVSVLYLYDTCLLDFQFLYVDLLTILPLAFVLSNATACPRLSKRKPPGSLFSTSVLVSIIGVAFLQFLFMLLTIALVRLHGFREPEDSNLDYPKPGPSNSAVFLVSNCQYLIVCLCFSEGRPFRESLFKDWLFVVTTAVILAVDLYLLLIPCEFVIEVVQMVSFGMKFKLELLLLIGVNALVTGVFEKWLVRFIARQEH